MSKQMGNQPLRELDDFLEEKPAFRGQFRFKCLAWL